MDKGLFWRNGILDLLFIVPLTTVCALLEFSALVFGIFLPNIITVIILSIFLIYMFVLPTFSIMAVHRLSRGKAIAIVFIAIPISVITFFYCLL